MMALLKKIGEEIVGCGKYVGRKVVDGAKTVGTVARDVAVAGMDRVTGVVTKRKNKERYSCLDMEYATLKNDVEQIQKNWGNKYTLSITRINHRKIHFQEKAFPRFLELGSNFANWRVYSKSIQENINNLPQFEFRKLKSKDQIFVFDHNELGIIAALKDCVPFLNYIRAQEVHARLECQEKILQEVKERLKAKDVQINKSLDAIANVADLFDFFAEFYDGLLIELELSINMMKSVRLWVCIDFFDDGEQENEQKIDICFLPQHHLDCLMAAEKTTRIVCCLVSRRYIETKSTDEILAVNDEDLDLIHKGIVDIEKMDAALELPQGA